MKWAILGGSILAAALVFLGLALWHLRHGHAWAFLWFLWLSAALLIIAFGIARAEARERRRELVSYHACGSCFMFGRAKAASAMMESRKPRIIRERGRVVAFWCSNLGAHVEPSRMACAVYGKGERTAWNEGGADG